MRYRSSNYVIGGLEKQEFVATGDRASYKGVGLKTLYMAIVTLASAIVFAILLLNNATTDFVYWVLPLSAILAFVCAMLAIIMPRLVPMFGSMYCVLQGVVVGAVSALIEAYFPGAAMMALLSTMGVFGVLVVLYSSGIIKVGIKMQTFILGFLISFLVFSIVTTLVAMFNQAARETLFGDSIFALIISGIAVLLASMVILLDLSRVDAIVKQGLHKDYEWTAAFGLIVTLIWLYMEFLRFFMIVYSRSSK